MVVKKNLEELPKDNLITPHGHKALTDEVERLWRVDRPKIVDEVHHAALQGDRSENAEYIYGKKKLREIDRRLEFLQRRIGRAKVIDPVRQAGNVIEFGATVTVKGDDNKTKIYSIVGEDEAAPDRRLISWKSPIGEALLGRKPGDIVEVETPRGVIELEVIQFAFQVLDQS